MYKITFTKQYKKDYKLIQKQNKNIDLIFKIIDLLSKGISLDNKYRNHKLKGEYNNYLECHIESDLILIYKIEKDILILYRIGSHSDLFK